MAYLAIAVVAVLALAALGMWLALISISLVLKVAMAGLIGGLADMAVPGRLPLGWLGAVIAGIAGGIVGSAILPTLGPTLLGFEVVPTFLGAVAVVGAYELVMRTRAGAP